jgi:DNA-binding MarR family transcriptional regulator
MLKHWHEGVPNDRMAHLVKDATRAFLRSLQARLADHNVQLGHWTYLRVLWEEDGLTQNELSLRVGVMAPTTVIALRSMESLGYVERKQSVDNKKNMYVVLTPAGQALKDKLVPLAEEVNALALAGLKASEVAATRKSLLVMIENLARDERALG